MKTTETQKSTTSNSHSSKPFFNKSGEGSFFSQSNESEQAFFTPYPIQAKLTIGQPNDIYEQEADAMSEKVVQKLDTTNSTAVVQNKCDDCTQGEELQKMEDEEMTISKKSIFESGGGINDRLIQRQGIKKVDPNIETQLQNSKGSGQPLDKRTRRNMEQNFDADFANVRVHTGNNAIQMSRNLEAQAFTNGSDIYFNKGKYSPNTRSGNKLLAHELTHVIQQGDKTIQPYRDKKNKNTKKKATHFGKLDARTLKEEEFKNSKTQPWIQTITVIFNKVIIDSAGLKIPEGTVKAEYFNNKAKKSPVTIPITGGSSSLGQTRPGNFLVHRIEGVGFNDSPIPAPDGTGFSGIGQKNRYSKSLHASMHYAIFYDGGRALHVGSLRNSSHGCVHCGGSIDLLKQVNYHSVVGKTNVKVFFVGEAYNEFIKKIAFTKDPVTGGHIFNGNVKIEDALLIMEDPETASKQRDRSLTELVILLNKGFPSSGDVVEGKTYKFEIIKADKKKKKIEEVKVIKK